MVIQNPIFITNLYLLTELSILRFIYIHTRIYLIFILLPKKWIVNKGKLVYFDSINYIN